MMDTFAIREELVAEHEGLYSFGNVIAQTEPLNVIASTRRYSSQR